MEEALAVIPKERLLLVGVREFIVALAVGLGFLALSRLSWLLLGIIVVLLVLFVPLTLGGLLWPISLLTFAFFAKQATRWHTGAGAVVVVLLTVIAVLAVTIGRYSDPPFHFAEAHVIRPDTKLSECGHGIEKKETCGAYLASSDDGVFVAGPSEQVITLIPKGRVKQLDLLPPPASTPPNPSVVGRITSALGIASLLGEKASLTPLDWWVRGQHHGLRILG